MLRLKRCYDFSLSLSLCLFLCLPFLRRSAIHLDAIFYLLKTMEKNCHCDNINTKNIYSRIWSRGGANHIRRNFMNLDLQKNIRRLPNFEFQGGSRHTISRFGGLFRIHFVCPFIRARVSVHVSLVRLQ